LIFPEKSDEREFLLGLQASADAKLLVRVVGIGWDFFVYSPLLLVIHQLIGRRLV
jgi:hypothetical protein